VNFCELFIRRPVMTILVMAGILIFGLASYRLLPVSTLPNVDFPTIQVTAELPGASPETMASAVATPLEKQFSTISGIDEMSSVSGQGVTRITIQFALDRDIDAAAQDVNSAIASAARQLPATMSAPPAFRKVNPADFPVFYLALTSDTLPLSTRNDILVFQTSPLDEDLEVVGPVTVKLFVSSSAPDTDFTAKLVDVYPPSADYPAGFDLNLTDGIVRARYRKSLEKAELMKPGEVTEVSIELYPTANLFKKGHRVRLDVSSSNFPRFDVNPNTGEPLNNHRRTAVAVNTRPVMRGARRRRGWPGPRRAGPRRSGRSRRHRRSPP